MSDNPNLSQSQQPQKLKHGGEIVVVLVLLFIWNLILGINNILSVIETRPFTYTNPYIIWVIVRTLLGIIFLIAAWKRKRWGAIGLVFTYLADALVVLLFGINLLEFLFSVFPGVLITLLFYFLMRRIWREMK